MMFSVIALAVLSMAVSGAPRFFTGGSSTNSGYRPGTSSEVNNETLGIAIGGAIGGVLIVAAIYYFWIRKYCLKRRRGQIGVPMKDPNPTESPTPMTAVSLPPPITSSATGPYGMAAWKGHDQKR